MRYLLQKINFIHILNIFNKIKYPKSKLKDVILFIYINF
jgi:hypothetical protein